MYHFAFSFAYKIQKQRIIVVMSEHLGCEGAESCWKACSRSRNFCPARDQFTCKGLIEYVYLKLHFLLAAVRTGCAVMLSLEHLCHFWNLGSWASGSLMSDFSHWLQDV